MSLILCYWSSRGIVQPSRYLLHHVGAHFEDRKLVGTEDRSNWLSIKDTVTGFDFLNLPYLVDGDLKLSQSAAILKYLARKYDLAGNDNQESAILEMVEEQTRDFLWGLITVAYDPDFDSSVKVYIDGLPEKLKLFEMFLNRKKFVMGDRITYADFYLYEALDQHRLLVRNCLQKFDNLCAFVSRIEDLPNIRKYIESDDFQRWPIYSPIAKFGGKGDYPMFY